MLSFDCPLIQNGEKPIFSRKVAGAILPCHKTFSEILFDISFSYTKADRVSEIFVHVILATFPILVVFFIIMWKIENVINLNTLFRKFPYQGQTGLFSIELCKPG